MYRPGMGNYVGSIPCSGTPAGLSGLGDCGCGCGGNCGGLGLFEAGLNFDQWGWAEWAAVGVGAYLAISLFGDTKRAARGTAGVYRRAKRRARSLAAA
jgi:hypothetical protein